MCQVKGQLDCQNICWVLKCETWKTLKNILHLQQGTAVAIQDANQGFQPNHPGHTSGRAPPLCIVFLIDHLQSNRPECNTAVDVGLTRKQPWILDSLPHRQHHSQFDAAVLLGLWELEQHDMTRPCRWLRLFIGWIVWTIKCIKMLVSNQFYYKTIFSCSFQLGSWTILN